MIDFRLLKESIMKCLNVICRLNRTQQSAMRNSTVTAFVLLGLTDDPQLQALIFLFLFLTYLLSITGNLTIISLILLDSHLQPAMHPFLQNFSF